jgi:hypothetical protein
MDRNFHDMQIKKYNRYTLFWGILALKEGTDKLFRDIAKNNPWGASTFRKI